MPSALWAKFEKHVGKLLKRNPRDVSHSYIPGQEIREYHYPQVYPPHILEERLHVARQHAILQRRAQLPIRKDGTSPLLGIDYLEVEEPNGVVVTAQLDAKHTSQDELPYKNCTSTIELAHANGMPTEIISNTDKCDGHLRSALQTNPKLKLRVVPFDDATTDAEEDVSPAAAGDTSSFVPRDYQVKALAELRDAVSVSLYRKILANLPAAFGKTHAMLHLLPHALARCNLCVILVTQIDLAKDVIKKFEDHHRASSPGVALRNMTSTDETDLVRTLQDPAEMNRFLADGVVPIIYHRTFEKATEGMDLRQVCILADEAQEYLDLVRTSQAELLVAFSAKREKEAEKKKKSVWGEIFDRVVTLDDADEDLMMARTPKVVLRISAAHDAGTEDAYDDIAHTIDSSVNVDLDDIARKVVDAHNNAPFRQSVVVKYDNDVKCRDFDELREKMHRRMVETNGDLYLCEFRRVSKGSRRDVYDEFFCNDLKRRLRTAHTSGKRRVALSEDDLRSCAMEAASRNSIIEVDGNYWVSCGFDIVRQDSDCKEDGFGELKKMLEHDRAGQILSKRQFRVGHDFPELRHLILSGLIDDPHVLYQLLMRLARSAPGKAYAMFTSTDRTSLDTFMRMVQLYDPKTKFIALECFENVPLGIFLSRSPSDWELVGRRIRRSKESIERILDARNEAETRKNLASKVIQHLYQHHRAARPTQTLLKLTTLRAPVDWENQLTVFIQDCLPTGNMVSLRMLLALEWHPFSRPVHPFLPAQWILAAPDETAPRLDAVNLQFRLTDDVGQLASIVDRALHHYVERNEPVPRGLVRIADGATEVVFPLRLAIVLRNAVQGREGYDHSPPLALPDALLDAPMPRMSTADDRKKSSIVFPIEFGHRDEYAACLRDHEAVLRHDKVRDLVYELGLSWQTTTDNLRKTLFLMTKWQVGYASKKPYTSTGKAHKNPPDEKTTTQLVLPPDFGLHSDIFRVHDEFTTYNGLNEHHSSVSHILSKLFYVQLTILYTLSPYATKARPSAAVLGQLTKIKIHSATSLQLADDGGADGGSTPPDAKRQRLAEGAIAADDDCETGE